MGSWGEASVAKARFSLAVAGVDHDKVYQQRIADKKIRNPAGHWGRMLLWIVDPEMDPDFEPNAVDIEIKEEMLAKDKV